MNSTSPLKSVKCRRSRIDASLKESLQKLRTDYVDLTLIHWPSPNDEVSVEEFMQALLEAKKEGLTQVRSVFPTSRSH